MKRTTNRLNHYLGRPSSRQDMKAMSAPNHGKSSLVGADGELVTAIHQQESTHNQLWIARHQWRNRSAESLRKVSTIVRRIVNRARGFWRKVSRHGGAVRILSYELLGFKNLLSFASHKSRVNQSRVQETKKDSCKSRQESHRMVNGFSFGIQDIFCLIGKRPCADLLLEKQRNYDPAFQFFGVYYHISSCSYHH